MKCNKCKTNNPDNNNFCGNCGAPLAPDLLAVECFIYSEYFRGKVRNEIKRVIEDKLKDREVVEAEAAIGIVSKVTGWVNMFARYVVIILVPITLILGFWGYNGVHDIQKGIKRAGKNAQRNMAEQIYGKAEKIIDNIVKKSDIEKKLNEELDIKLNAKAEEMKIIITSKYDKKIDKIEKQIKNIEFLGFIKDAEIEEIKKKVKKYPELLKVKNSSGETVLHKAVEYNLSNFVIFFISEGVDVNAKDEYGKTPLHWASLNGFTDVAECLISKRAKVNIKNKNGMTPLHWAAHFGNTDLAKLLISKNADVNVKSKYGIPLRNDITPL